MFYMFYSFKLSSHVNRLQWSFLPSPAATLIRDLMPSSMCDEARRWYNTIATVSFSTSL